MHQPFLRPVHKVLTLTMERKFIHSLIAVAHNSPLSHKRNLLRQHSINNPSIKHYKFRQMHHWDQRLAHQRNGIISANDQTATRLFPDNERASPSPPRWRPWRGSFYPPSSFTFFPIYGSSTQEMARFALPALRCSLYPIPLKKGFHPIPTCR